MAVGRIERMPKSSSAAAAQPPKRGPGRPLVSAVSQEQIVDAALSIIDADGVDGLNMRRLATQLGVNAPTLYHYFDNKEAILFAVARRLVQRMPARKPRNEAWRDYFVGVLIQYRQVLLQHPKTVGLMAHLRMSSLVGDGTFEHATVTMGESGIPPELMLTITEAGEALVFGWVFSEVANDERRGPSTEGPARRQLLEANRLSDDRRFELACYALTDGFITSVALRGPAAWGKESSTSRRRS